MFVTLTYLFFVSFFIDASSNFKVALLIYEDVDYDDDFAGLCI